MKHYGLKRAGFNVNILAAFDVNPHCNKTYNLNFGIKPIQKNIQNIPIHYLDSFDANCWLMSPPCQPYTRTGKKLDEQDPRAEGFIYLINNLKNLKNMPQFIFLENVVNFERSNTRNLFVRELIQLGYTYKEWIISPTQLGIPNDRPRYYLTAIFVGKPQNQVSKLNLITEWSFDPIYPIHSKKVRNYVELNLNDQEFEELQIPQSMIKNRNSFDQIVIAKLEDNRTSCFTKAYGHHGLSSGCFLSTKNQDFDVEILKNPELAAVELGLRFFSPNEIALLHCFPVNNGFSWPSDLTLLQRWKCLGNSMCVGVVSEIMRHEFK
jgi:tRNA (cytosine38-C5)-methyltransferase